MNYKKHYNKLIDRARNRLLEGYGEIHHIIPTCMGGDNVNTNLIKLTGREHFIAHILLVKIYPNTRGLIYAVHSMCRFNKRMDRSKNRMYGWLRELHARSVSEMNTGKQKGKKNSRYGTCWMTNIVEGETTSVKKEEVESYIQMGWVRGRNKKQVKCKQCDTLFTKKKQENCCSEVCRNKNRGKHKKPNIVAENFTELYAEYQKTGSYYNAFKNLGIGYNNNVYARFKIEIEKYKNTP